MMGLHIFVRDLLTGTWVLEDPMRWADAYPGRIATAVAAFLNTGGRHCPPEICNVGPDRGVTCVFDWRRADRTAGRSPRGAADQRAAGFRVLIEVAEYLPVATVLHGRQREVGHARFLVCGFRNRIIPWPPSASAAG